MNRFLSRDAGVSFGSTPTPRWLAVIALVASPALVLLGCSSEKEPPATTAAALEPRPSPPAGATTTPSAEYLAQLELGKSLLDANEAEAALAPLERARRQQPEAFAVHNNLCVAYGMLQRRDEAIASCQHALTIEAGNQLGKNNLAWVSGLKPAPPAPATPEK
jgi:Flp pilus assembly protein TadD